MPSKPRLELYTAPVARWEDADHLCNLSAPVGATLRGSRVPRPWRGQTMGWRRSIAQVVCRTVEKSKSVPNVPLAWATTQNNLGAALQALGERESGTAPLDEAMAAYREALKEFRNGGAHHQESVTQRNLEKVEQTRAARKAAGAASSPSRKG